MSDKDAIKELFRDKLQSHEVMPSDAVWSSVSSSLGHSAASGFGAASFLKVAAAVVGVTTIGVLGYVLLDTNEASPAITNTTKINNVAPNEAAPVAPSSEDPVSVSNEDEAVLFIEPVVSPFSSAEKQIKSTNLVQETQPEDIVLKPMAPVSSLNEKDLNSEISENVVLESPVSTQVSSIQSAPQVPEEISTNAVEPETETNEPEMVSEAEEEVALSIEEALVLPNIFTPNGDRVNDVFEIEIGEKLEFQIVILNQSNQVVFKTTDAEFKWDGIMLNGDPAPSGNYVYFLSAKNMNGADFVKSSTLMIQR